MVREMFRREPNRSVNPDEVVAVGAAIQAGILQGDSTLRDVLLLDVTPLSLGIETLGGVMTRLIERNTTIPTTKKEVFSTASDHQPAVEIKVHQGEREMAKDNRLLGNFVLDGIPPAPRGVPQIEVQFDIDANGILKVSAKDLGTKKERSIRIESSSGLSKEEVEKMRKEAESHVEEDKQKRKVVELKNSSDHLIYTTEKFLQDSGDAVPEKEKAKINAVIDRLKSARDSEDVDGMAKIQAELQKASQEIGKAMYEKASTGAGTSAGGGQESQGPSSASGSPGPGDGKGDDNVIDADYEVKS